MNLKQIFGRYRIFDAVGSDKFGYNVRVTSYEVVDGLGRYNCRYSEANGNIKVDVRFIAWIKQEGTKPVKIDEFVLNDNSISDEEFGFLTDGNDEFRQAVLAEARLFKQGMASGDYRGLGIDWDGGFYYTYEK